MTAKSATPAGLTWSGVTARRMARHALAEPAADLDPAGVAGVLCGAHAQVLSAAELSIGRRVAGATRADVRRALREERTLVKTFGPRGTIHLLPAADLPMWAGALSALPSSVPMHPEGVRFAPGQAWRSRPCPGGRVPATARGIAGDLAVDEVDGAPGVTSGQLRAVRDQDQGLPAGVEVQQQLPERLPVGGIQRPSRLVGQQQGRGVHQGAGDRHPLPFPARQATRVAVRITLDAQLLQKLARPGPGPGTP